MTDASLVPLNALAADQKVVAERALRAPSKAPAVQAACDVGLFSDDAKQAELFTTPRGKANEDHS
jgi:hypothetical protein